MMSSGSRFLGLCQAALTRLQELGVGGETLGALFGCGNKFTKILEGQAGLYVFPCAGTSRWDTCAPQALLGVLGQQRDRHAVAAGVELGDGIDEGRHHASRVSSEG